MTSWSERCTVRDASRISLEWSGVGDAIFNANALGD
jgi:hypothetical protein